MRGATVFQRTLSSILFLPLLILAPTVNSQSNVSPPERDKVSYRGGLLIAEAFALERTQKQDGWRKAIEKYEAALQLWQSIKDIDWEASTLSLIAGAYISLVEKQKAFDFANRAVLAAETGI